MHNVCTRHARDFGEAREVKAEGRGVFLSDATATYDYPDNGFGAMPNAAAHRATLVVLVDSTAQVMSVADLAGRVVGAAAAGPAGAAVAELVAS